MAEPLVIAMSGKTELALLPALANRHGCVTGATGTGKTVTMQKMAESFSGIGVPGVHGRHQGRLHRHRSGGQVKRQDESAADRAFVAGAALASVLR